MGWSNLFPLQKKEKKKKTVKMECEDHDYEGEGGRGSDGLWGLRNCLFKFFFFFLTFQVMFRWKKSKT